MDVVRWHKPHLDTALGWFRDGMDKESFGEKAYEVSHERWIMVHRERARRRKGLIAAKNNRKAQRDTNVVRGK